ncbi:MAG: RDD family protein [Bacteroidota bacterium]
MPEKSPFFEDPFEREDRADEYNYEFEDTFSSDFRREAAIYYQTASSWQRLSNYFIDSFAIMAFVGLVMGLLGEEFIVFIPFMHFFYYVISEKVWGKTLGKLITGTYVIAEDGAAPTTGQIIGRTLSRYIPFEVYSWIFAKYGWHDTLSKTRVIKENSLTYIDPARLD